MISFETVFLLDMYKEVILLRGIIGAWEKQGLLFLFFYISGIVKCFTSNI